MHHEKGRKSMRARRTPVRSTAPRREKRIIVGRCRWCGKGIERGFDGYRNRSHRLQHEAYMKHVQQGGGIFAD